MASDIHVFAAYMYSISDKEKLALSIPIVLCGTNSLHKKCLKVSYSVVFLGLVQFMYVWQNVPSIIQDAVVIFFATTVESSKINTMYKNTSLTGVVLFPVFTGI